LNTRVEYTEIMNTARYVYWQDGDQWLGYFEEYPDYITQGESIEDLREHLKDLFGDLTGGEVPGIRRVAELALR
jgi:predicted RNase H-like HicB family nuclease